VEPGDRVTHDSYGLGTVVSVSGKPDDPQVAIDFGNGVGQKHFVLRYAPIEKL
jgi:DNA helicase-2/ATP-dependent DNA helicase PcrA